MIYDIIGFAALAHLMANFFEDLGILQFKPFNCNMCLAFWLALVPSFVFYEGYGILVAAMAGVTSELIYRVLQKL